MFPSVTRGTNSSTPVIIKTKIFGREVGQVHMDSRSSCEVIYEHYFMKLKQSIRASKIDSKVPLIGKDSNAENGNRGFHHLWSHQMPHCQGNQNCVLNIRIRPDKRRNDEGKRNIPTSKKGFSDTLRQKKR
nr:reverse transcriptase domain-containing protein [Tanacetum cinerariifolium]